MLRELLCLKQKVIALGRFGALFLIPSLVSVGFKVFEAVLQTSRASLPARRDAERRHQSRRRRQRSGATEVDQSRRHRGRLQLDDAHPRHGVLQRRLLHPRDAGGAADPLAVHLGPVDPLSRAQPVGRLDRVWLRTPGAGLALFSINVLK